MKLGPFTTWSGYPGFMSVDACDEMDPIESATTWVTGQTGLSFDAGKALVKRLHDI